MEVEIAAHPVQLKSAGVEVTKISLRLDEKSRLYSHHSKHEIITQCWSTICDDDPASNQHWVNVFAVMRILPE